MNMVAMTAPNIVGFLVNTAAKNDHVRVAIVVVVPTVVIVFVVWMLTNMNVAVNLLDIDAVPKERMMVQAVSCFSRGFALLGALSLDVFFLLNMVLLF